MDGWIGVVAFAPWIKTHWEQRLSLPWPQWTRCLAHGRCSINIYQIKQNYLTSKFLNIENIDSKYSGAKLFLKMLQLSTSFYMDVCSLAITIIPVSQTQIPVMVKESQVCQKLTEPMSHTYWHSENRMILMMRVALLFFQDCRALCRIPHKYYFLKFLTVNL